MFEIIDDHDDEGRRSIGILQAHLVSLTAQVSQKWEKPGVYITSNDTRTYKESVYSIFLYKIICCGYLLETPRSCSYVVGI